MGKKSILHNNYELLLFLREEGMQAEDIIINEAARIGNIFLVIYFFAENSIPKEILVTQHNLEILSFLNIFMSKKELISIEIQDVYSF